MTFINFISSNPNNIKPFSLFSSTHILAIITILVVTFLSIILFKYTGLAKYRKQFRYSLLTIIIIEEILFKLWITFGADVSIINHLSLNLCGITLILIIFLLINKNQLLYEVVFFWGLAGAIQAILTPDLGQYGFPHFRFFQFFLSHGLIIVVTLYMTVVEGLRPLKGSLKRIIIITNGYALIIGIVNVLLGTNYLFIARKPESASLLDFLGPWPWYLLSLEALAILSFVILYSPFLISGAFKRGDSKELSN